MNTKPQIESPFIGVKEAAVLLGCNHRDLSRVDALGRCARFPQLKRIQHKKAVNGQRGTAIWFVRAQVEELSRQLQEPPKFDIAVPIHVEPELVARFLAAGPGGERALKQLGVRV